MQKGSVNKIRTDMSDIGSSCHVSPLKSALLMWCKKYTYNDVQVIELESRSNSVDPDSLLRLAVLRSLQSIKDHLTSNVLAVECDTILEIIYKTVGSQ